MLTTVFFDLDGTLTDSCPGIFAGAAYALTALGYPTRPEEVSSAFIGPPLYDCFREVYRLGEEEARRAVTLYREYYGERGIFENRVYDGILPMLSELASSGFSLYLATGKPVAYARRIVSHFGLDRYLTEVFGAEFDGTRGDKAELLSYALGVTGKSAAESVMVGDRSYDMRGAVATGITPLGVLWGYGDEAELVAAGGHLMARTPRDVVRLLRS